VYGAVSSGISARGWLDAEGIVVEGTRSRADGGFGNGITVASSGDSRIARAFIDDNRMLGIQAGGEGQTLTLEDVVVARTGPDATGGAGYGIYMDGGTLAATRLALVRNRALGLFELPGSTVTLTHAHILGAADENAAGLPDLGIRVDGGSLRARFLWVEGQRANALQATGAGVDVSLEDFFVTDTRPLAVTVVDDQTRERVGTLDAGGAALTMTRGARVRAARGVFDRSTSAGIAVASESQLDVEDVAITRTREGVLRDASGALQNTLWGYGLSASLGGKASMRRCAFHANHAAALFATGEGTAVTIDTGAIETTLPNTASGKNGQGVQAQGRASVALTNVRVRGNRVAGIVALGGASLALTGATIVNTGAGAFTSAGPSGTTTDGTSYDGIGDGLVILDGATATLDDVEVHGCERAGLLFSQGKGSVVRTASRANRFGLVTQGSPLPTIDENTCVILGNREENRVTSGELPVPNAALPLPQMP
jgi:hypothetical protein